MRKLVILLAISILFLSCGNNKNSVREQGGNNLKKIHASRYVNDNTIVSKKIPDIEIKVDDEFSYIGTFDFEIIANSDEYPEEMQGKPVAAGDRFVFASADANQKVNKLFIVQFEGFLTENDFTYNYNFDSADFIGKNKYRHNTWFYDSKKLAEENPNNEGAKTRTFLKEKGFLLEDQFMMSRFVGLASEDRKNEIIIYYLEMLKNTTGYSLDDYENYISKEVAEAIRAAFVKRSKKSFKIIKG